jgi:hypothetical protein
MMKRNQLKGYDLLQNLTIEKLLEDDLSVTYNFVKKKTMSKQLNYTVIIFSIQINYQQSFKSKQKMYLV